MTDIQKKITDYLNPAGLMSDFTLRCFAGMIETGEATLADFESVGGIELATKVEASV